LTKKDVEAAVIELQEALSEGDPSDASLRSRALSQLAALREAYRGDPKAFTPDTIAALRELRELLEESA
jgi:hypothetical protein